MNNYPKAKSSDIVVSNYKDEMLLYDLKTHKCHSLNTTASAIWQECNGKRDIAEIAEKLYGNTAKKTREDLVTLTLNELAKGGLMESEENLVFNSRIARREMIKNIGKASMIALPIVGSVVAPTASHAQSCPEPLCPGDGNCCSAGETCVTAVGCCPTPQACNQFSACCPTGQICTFDGCCNPGAVCNFGFNCCPT